MIARLTGGTLGSDDFERKAFSNILSGAMAKPVGTSLGPKRTDQPLVWRPGSSKAANTATVETGDSDSIVRSELVAQRELNTALTARLGVLEESQRRLRGELVDKEAGLLSLRQKNADLERAARASEGGTGALLEELASLRSERNALRKQVSVWCIV
jgi:hypothetical protein